MLISTVVAPAWVHAVCLSPVHWKGLAGLGGSQTPDPCNSSALAKMLSAVLSETTESKHLISLINFCNLTFQRIA